MSDIPRDLLGERCVRLRQAQLRYERALDEFNVATGQTQRAQEDLLDAMKSLSVWADRVRDELVVPSELTS